LINYKLHSSSLEQQQRQGEKAKVTKIAIVEIMKMAARAVKFEDHSSAIE